MRAIEFAPEETQLLVDQHGKVLAEVKRILEEHCGPYLTALGGKVAGNILWRGTYNKVDTIEEFEVNKNRIPKDISQVQQKVIDEYFQKKFHNRFRERSVFATGSKIDTLEYGDSSYIFFPVGEFRFCWSPIYEDLYGFVPHLPRFVTSGSAEFNRIMYDTLESVKAGKYIADKELLKAIQSRHEIMFDCKSYILINTKRIGIFPSDFHAI